jgi:hypothetical protein
LFSIACGLTVAQAFQQPPGLRLRLEKRRRVENHILRCMFWELFLDRESGL